MAKVTERGWPSHFVSAHKCLFRRNTLIEGDCDSVVVSTVGLMLNKETMEIEQIGVNRYYETIVFGAKEEGHYIEADVGDERCPDSQSTIMANSVYDLPEGVDNIANEMHDKIVAEFLARL